MLKDESFRDIVLLPEGALLKGASFVRKVEDDLMEEVDRLRAAAKERRDKSDNKRDFRLEFDGMLFRVVVVPDVEGEEWTLCRIETAPRTLSELKFPADVAKEALGLRSGLLLFSGPMAGGKTSSASGYILDYLMSRPCTATTLEDPPEIKLHGWHGGSYCQQREVPYSEFGEEFIPALRKRNDLIFFGEIRAGNAAVPALQAASAGSLIVATIHAGSVEETCLRIQSMALESLGLEYARSLLSEGLAGIIHQTLRKTGEDSYRLSVTPFWVHKNPNSIKTMIREGRLQGLANEIDMQKRQRGHA